MAELFASCPGNGNGTGSLGENEDGNGNLLVVEHLIVVVKLRRYASLSGWKSGARFGRVGRAVEGLHRGLDPVVKSFCSRKKKGGGGLV